MATYCILFSVRTRTGELKGNQRWVSASSAGAAGRAFHADPDLRADIAAQEGISERSITGIRIDSITACG